MKTQNFIFGLFHFPDAVPKPTEKPKDAVIEPKVTVESKVTSVQLIEPLIPTQKEEKVSEPLTVASTPSVIVSSEQNTSDSEKELKVTVSEEKTQTGVRKEFHDQFSPAVIEGNKTAAKSQATKIMQVRNDGLTSLQIDSEKTLQLQFDSSRSSDSSHSSDKANKTDSENESKTDNEKEEIDSAQNERTKTEDTDSEISATHHSVNAEALASKVVRDSDTDKDEIVKPKMGNKDKLTDSANSKAECSVQLQHSKGAVVDMNSNISKMVNVKTEEKVSVPEVTVSDATKVSSLCLETSELEKPKGLNKFRSGEIRRTQSTRAPSSEKPEWLQVKLRKVGSKQTPFVIPEKNKAITKPQSESSESDTSLSAVTDKLSPVDSVRKEVKLSRSQSARIVDRNTPGALKDSTNSPLNYSNKDPIKLTPVAERARIFQMNESSTPSGKQSPVEIISKAINLSRAESMKYPAGHRPVNVQRSSSFRTPAPTEKGDVALELTPQQAKVGLFPL